MSTAPPGGPPQYSTIFGSRLSSTSTPARSHKISFGSYGCVLNVFVNLILHSFIFPALRVLIQSLPPKPLRVSVLRRPFKCICKVNCQQKIRIIEVKYNFLNLEYQIYFCKTVACLVQRCAVCQTEDARLWLTEECAINAE